MSLETLQITWYFLIGILIVGYAILDGFDLGVGVLAPFVARDDQERRLLFQNLTLISYNVKTLSVWIDQKAHIHIQVFNDRGDILFRFFLFRMEV